MINTYSVRAAGMRGMINLITLNNKGQLQLAVMARKYGDWHCFIEDLAMMALDIDSQCRSEKRGLRAPSLQIASLAHYLGVPPYDIAQEIGLVETSCTDEVLDILKAAKLSTSLGCAVYKWTRETITKDLRVPAILLIGWCLRPLRSLVIKVDQRATRTSSFSSTRSVSWPRTSVPTTTSNIRRRSKTSNTKTAR